MMLRTCTVQANLDYASEADAIRKLRISLALQPIVTAMFANSPFVEGRAFGGRSYRAKVWLDMDPDRSGLLPFAWRDDMSIRKYVEWALDVPMFLVKRDRKVLRNTSQTFRMFMKDGLSGHIATMGDWETHVNTLFPEVRLKKIIEMRGANARPAGLICPVQRKQRQLPVRKHQEPNGFANLRNQLTCNPCARSDLLPMSRVLQRCARPAGAFK